MMTLNYLWLFFQLLIGYNLVLPMVLYVAYRMLPLPIALSKAASNYDYAIIVTAYEQTDLLPAVVKSLLSLQYDNYLIYIVADKCDITNLHFSSDRVILLRPESVLASNTRSHLFAMANFKRPHELLTIIDSDNLVDPDYLNQLNAYFSQGYDAVQGVRKPKTISSNIAAMDAARDLYYHFFDGEVLFRLGSSATLAGSGMAFKTKLYRECFQHFDMEGAGFDKVLQSKIVLQRKRIAFAPEAIVYDEKTAHSNQLVNQRSRWINTWFRYIGLGLRVLGNGIKNLDRNQSLFGLILVRPPLFLFIILSLFCLVINVMAWNFVVVIWILAFSLFVLGFYLALRHGNAEPRIYRALRNIPTFMYLQVSSLLKSKNANKRSVATIHLVSDERNTSKI